MPSGNPEYPAPVYLKTGADAPPPDEDFYYLLTGDGLFVNRNSRFFRSSAPVRGGPPGLAAHAPALEIRLPPIPRDLAEQLIGFLHRVAERHQAEAIALLAWGDSAGYQAVVPPQLSVVSRWSNDWATPCKLDYQFPEPPAGTVWIGDIHSHAHLDAYTSELDALDLMHRPGLHIVAGRLLNGREPPDLEAAVSVDGTPFRVDNPLALFDGYTRRRPDAVPEDWLARVRVTTTRAYGRARRYAHIRNRPTP
jgi:proteasome lid subunit RPN8/RPN11